MPVSMNNVSQVNNTQSIKQQPKTTDEKTKSFPTKTAVVVGTGLAALAAVGIYLATKGKGGKAVQQATHNTQEAVQNVAQNAQEATNTIKEMTVDAFKQAGNKFNKGKAVTNTGEAFTGNITHQTKDGKKIVMEYENGLLNKSTKYDGENALSQKRYYIYEDGSIAINQDGDFIYRKIKNKTGKITLLQNQKQGLKRFYYDDNGTLKGLEHGDSKFLYTSDGTKKMKIQANGGVEFYDKNGASTDKIKVDGPDSLSYHDLDYRAEILKGLGHNRTYSYTTPQGAEGVISRTRFLGEPKKVSSSLQLTTSEGNEYLVSRNGKDVQIKRLGEKDAIAKDSDEYKNVLAQSNDFMKQFFAKYKTALGLQRQAYEGVDEFKALQKT